MKTEFKIIKQIRWKALLAVFKIKRFVNRWFGLRKLDYEKEEIFILVDTLREYETRSQSVKKEPKTVAWIEKCGGIDAVFYDVGANIGAYSLIAAKLGARVFAFEPALPNAYKLHENILLNNLNKQITVMPVVLTEKNYLLQSFYRVRDRGFGASRTFSSFEEASQNSLEQTFPAITLDTCIKTFSLLEPTMIKIDVDGAELEVLKGAQTLLASSKLKNIIIEVDNKYTETAHVMLKDAGFKLIDQEVESDDVTNYIFERS